MRIVTVNRLMGALPAAAMSFVAGGAHATSTTGSMPWDSPLTTIENDITGPVAVAVAVVAVVLTGLGVALGGEGSFMRRAFAILFGLSVAFMGASGILTFFNASSTVIP